MTAVEPSARPHSDVYVWPANLPSGARWLPYSAEPIRPAPTLAPPAPTPAPAVPATGRRLPPSYWQRLVVISFAAGLIGIGGGMLVGMLAGIR